MQNQTVCKKKKIVSSFIFISGCLIFSMLPVTAYAQSVSVPVPVSNYSSCYSDTEESRLKKDVQEVTKMMEDVFTAQLQDKENKVKTLIMEKGYDYTLTMETFYGNGNPYQDVDYTELIATYSAIKEYCQKNGITMDKGISDIDFLTMEIKEKSLKETEAVLIENYTEVEPGLYERDGNRTIETEETVGIYEKAEEGNYYIRTGEETITPKEVEILYGEVLLCFIGTDKLYELFGVPEEKVKEMSSEKEDIITAKVNENTLSQSVFVQIPVEAESELNAISEEDRTILEELLRQVEEDRQYIISTALSLVGSVPYQWGGKASAPGYDSSWYLYNENGEQKGLDCSGFVQWVYMTCGYDNEVTNLMTSTQTMLENFEDISYEELQPGDIGLLNHGESVNHTGIYLGNGYFIHCSSEKKTVTVNKFPFRYFKKVLNGKNNVDKTENSSYLNNKYTNGEILLKNYTNSVSKEQSSTETVSVTGTANVREEDVLLLAKLIEHEAGNQGYNGKVAVGEVVLNRVNSPHFEQNTLYDVIYAKNQFSYVEKIETITPAEDTISVARLLLEGKIRIFNNPDVLFYKNPMITDGISPTEQIDWGTYKWYTAVNEHAFYVK